MRGGRFDAERARALFKELEFGRLLRDLQAAEGSLTAGAPGLLAAGASTSGAVPGTTPPALPLVAAQPGGAQDAKVELLLEESAVRAAVAAVEGVPAGLVPVLGDGSPQRARIVGLGFAGAGRAFYLPIGHHYLGGPAQLGAEALAKLLAPLVDGPAPRHLHDRKRAIHALGRLGLSLTAPGEDTDLASRLLVPTRREHLLEDVVRERARIDLPPAPIARRGGPGLDGLPVEAIAEWAGAAASALVALAPAVVAELEARGLTKVYREVELPLVPVLAEMEQTGIAVDRGAMEGMSAEFGAAMRELEARIHSAAGHSFNIASTRELARVLFEELALPVQRKLKTGPSTDQEVLERLAELHPLPGLVLEHRSLAKLKGTYVDALPLLIDAGRRPDPHHLQPGGGGDRPALLVGPEPAEHPRSGPRSPAGSAPPSSRRTGCGSCRPTTRRSSCGSWPTTPRTRRCSSPSGVGRTCTPAPRPRRSRSRPTR